MRLPSPPTPVPDKRRSTFRPFFGAFGEDAVRNRNHLPLCSRDAVANRRSLR